MVMVVVVVFTNFKINVFLGCLYPLCFIGLEIVVKSFLNLELISIMLHW